MLRSILIIVFFGLSLSSCDKTHVVEYSVRSDAERTIMVRVQKMGEPQIDTNVINGGQSVILERIFIEARNSRVASEEIEFPFSFIALHDLEGNVPSSSSCEGNFSQEDCWPVPRVDKNERFFDIEVYMNENYFD